MPCSCRILPLVGGPTGGPRQAIFRKRTRRIEILPSDEEYNRNSPFRLCRSLYLVRAFLQFRIASHRRAGQGTPSPFSGLVCEMQRNPLEVLVFCARADTGRGPVRRRAYCGRVRARRFTASAWRRTLGEIVLIFFTVEGLAGRHRHVVHGGRRYLGNGGDRLGIRKNKSGSFCQTRGSFFGFLQQVTPRLRRAVYYIPGRSWRTDNMLTALPAMRRYLHADARRGPVARSICTKKTSTRTDVIFPEMIVVFIPPAFPPYPKNPRDSPASSTGPVL